LGGIAVQKANDLGRITRHMFHLIAFEPNGNHTRACCDKRFNGR